MLELAMPIECESCEGRGYVISATGNDAKRCQVCGGETFLRPEKQVIHAGSTPVGEAVS